MGLVAVVIASLGAPVCALAATSVLVAHGQTGQNSWSLSMSAKPLGSMKLPGVCADFEITSASGPVVINSGTPACVGPSIGRRTAHGVRWSFDLRASGAHGIVQMLSSVAGFTPSGLRYIVLLVDPRARTVVATLKDGERVHMETVALPPTLHRPACVAWSVSAIALSNTVTPQQLDALTVRRAVAYDRRHRVVGTLTARGSASQRIAKRIL